MKSVSVKEARLLEQWLNTTIASVKWIDLINFFNKDMAVIAKAEEGLRNSELYKSVWGDIEAKAKELVDNKCRPEWDKISEEMKPIWEKANALSKEKAEKKDEWTEEKENELKDLDKQLWELSIKYQKVTDEANAELNEYKEKRINEEQWGCFFLDEEEYNTVGWYVWWNLPTNE